jgi:hypothetical protein
MKLCRFPLLKKINNATMYSIKNNRREIMEYKVVSANGWTTDSAVKELEKRVNDLIKQGWEPQGGVMVVALNDYVYQALIKRATVVNK